MKKDIKKLPLVSVVCIGLSISVYFVNAVDDFTVRNKRQTYSGRSMSNYGSNANQASTNTGSTGINSQYSNQASGYAGYGNQASSGNTGYQSSGTNSQYSNQVSGNTGYGNQASAGITGYGNQASSGNTNSFPSQYSGSQTQSGYQGSGSSSSSGNRAYIDLSGASSSGSNMGSTSNSNNMNNYALNTGTFYPGDTEYAYGVAGRTFGTGYIAEALGYGYRQGVDANGKNVGYTAIGYLGVLSGK